MGMVLILDKLKFTEKTKKKKGASFKMGKRVAPSLEFGE